jgi:hypothetical protein
MCGGTRGYLQGRSGLIHLDLSRYGTIHRRAVEKFADTIRCDLVRFDRRAWGDYPRAKADEPCGTIRCEGDRRVLAAAA